MYSHLPVTTKFNISSSAMNNKLIRAKTDNNIKFISNMSYCSQRLRRSPWIHETVKQVVLSVQENFPHRIVPDQNIFSSLTRKKFTNPSKREQDMDHIYDNKISDPLSNDETLSVEQNFKNFKKQESMNIPYVFNDALNNLLFNSNNMICELKNSHSVMVEVKNSNLTFQITIPRRVIHNSISNNTLCYSRESSKKDQRFINPDAIFQELSSKKGDYLLYTFKKIYINQLKDISNKFQLLKNKIFPWNKSCEVLKLEDGLANRIREETLEIADSSQTLFAMLYYSYKKIITLPIRPEYNILRAVPYRKQMLHSQKQLLNDSQKAMFHENKTKPPGYIIITVETIKISQCAALLIPVNHKIAQWKYHSNIQALLQYMAILNNITLI